MSPFIRSFTRSNLKWSGTNLEILGQMLNAGYTRDEIAREAKISKSNLSHLIKSKFEKQIVYKLKCS